MKFNNSEALVYIPDGTEEAKAIERTTDLCISAHQDDIEIMSYGAISDCFGRSDKWFTGLVVTNGAGSPRTGVYANYSDEDMKKVRIEEQKTAAKAGGYAAQFLLSYTSSDVKKKDNPVLVDELESIFEKCSPKVVYTHNLADKHDTHVATAVKVIEALRKMPKDKRPEKVYSLEVWRSLDWLCDEDKTVFDTSKYPNLAAAVLGVYDSQISGGKRYDAAAIGRRLANATFFASHDVDSVESVSYGLDITDLVNDESLNMCDFIVKYIDRFKDEIKNRVSKFTK